MRFFPVVAADFVKALREPHLYSGVVWCQGNGLPVKRQSFKRFSGAGNRRCQILVDQRIAGLGFRCGSKAGFGFVEASKL